MVFRNAKILTSSLLVSFLLLACSATNDDGNGIQPPPREPVDVVLDTLLTGLSNPWGMAHLPDGGILITERAGTLHLFSEGQRRQVSGMPAIQATGQGGLMEVVLHPQFEQNSLIYFSASVRQGAGFSTALFRATYSNAALSNVENIFQSLPLNTSGAHFGSRIVFDAAGYVYLCLGDRGAQNSAQDNSNHAGTVVRLRDDGSIPADNPFVGGSGGEQPAIWSFGHRNPQGMAVHPVTGKIWLHEHGPRGGDEINILEKGGNFGWPLATFGINYDGSTITPDTAYPGTIQPIYHWTPSIAPCGMAFYTSDSIPQWKGNLFLGALAGSHLCRLQITDNSVAAEERLLQGFARFRAVSQGNDGYLYFLTESPGMLCRFRPQR